VGDAGEVPELRERLEEAQRGRVQAETRLEAERKNLVEQRALLAEAEVKLKDAFAALSSDALKDSREQFLGQAEERLRPLQALLAKYEEELKKIEGARKESYGGLAQHLKGLGEAQQLLRKETHTLSTALRSPTARGRWAEFQLHNVVELAGMSPYCDFSEQESVETEGGRLRPDMIVRLPNDRTVVVDSKAPDQFSRYYIESVAADDDKARQEALGRYVGALRTRVQELGRKDYASQFDNTPDFVIMYLPGESFFRAALERDASLLEYAWERKVLVASPVILIGLLRAVATGWQEHQLAENAQRIAEVGKDLHDRIRVFAEHLSRVGKGLKGATDAYNAAVGSYERNLEPGARKLAELGASSGKELPGVEAVEGPTRALPEAGEPSDG